MKTIAILAVGAGLTVAAAFASAETPSDAKDTRRICRDSGRQLGSHVRTARRCRTAEQWRLEDEEKAQMPSSLRLTEGQNDGHPPRQPQ